MNSKNIILNAIRRNVQNRHIMPDLDIKGIEYTDPLLQFMDMIRAVGGEAMFINDITIDEAIGLLYPGSNNIASDLPELTINNIHPSTLDDPHQLKNIDLAIVRGDIGVAENGAVWINQNVKERALYFIAEYLILVLDRSKIVNNMHEAYKQITFNDHGFGVFISGPSKTADIEQALVIGAHGAKGLTVLIQ